MAVPFGISVGDFIAVAKLGKDICSALRESGGSIQQWATLEKNIDRYRRALKNSKDIYSSSLELDEAARNIVKGIEEALEGCLDATAMSVREMEPYRKAFAEANDKRIDSVKRGMKKIKFVFDKPKVLDEYREALEHHQEVYSMKCTELQTYLQRRNLDKTEVLGTDQRIIMEVIQVVREEQVSVGRRTLDNGEATLRMLEKMQRHIEKYHASSSTQGTSGQSSRVMEISDETNDEGEQSISGRGVYQSPHSSWDITTRRQQEVTLNDLRIAITIQIAFLIAVFAKIARLIDIPDRIKYTWKTWSIASNSMVVIDFTGRPIQFQINHCTTLPDLQDLIEISFRRRPGHLYVSSKVYELFDGLNVLDEETYCDSLKPGKSLVMRAPGIGSHTLLTFEHTVASYCVRKLACTAYDLNGKRCCRLMERRDTKILAQVHLSENPIPSLRTRPGIDSALHVEISVLLV